MTIWTNHDRAALNDWLNADLGQKFLHYLRESRPKLDGEALDINRMAMQGAIYAGYEKAIAEIDQMRQIPTVRAPPSPYVDTHKD